MEILLAIINFVKELFVPVGAYVAGKKSKENDQLKAENKKLKEYKKIDDKEIQVNEVYDESNW